MLPDPEKVAEASEWLQRALSDLQSADILIRATPPRPDTAVFHCQQAVEKAWKAFLFWHDVPFRKTHDLRELGNACVSIDTSLGELAERAEDLTQFAWVFRYPGGPKFPSVDEAHAAWLLATEVYEAVLARLPEVRP